MASDGGTAMDAEHAEYRCSACRKIIKLELLACQQCDEMYFHPGCFLKHRIPDVNGENVGCPGPYDRFSAGADEDMRRKIVEAIALRRNAGTGSSMVGSASGKAKLKDHDMDVMMGMIIDLNKKMNDMCITNGKSTEAMKKELERVLRETEGTRRELEKIRGQLGGLQQTRTEDATGSRTAGRPQQDVTGGKSIGTYSDVLQKKKEAVIVIKPKKQLESEATKRVIKESVDIKSMSLGVSRLKKGHNGSILLGCEAGKECEALKDVFQKKMGNDFRVTEVVPRRPKVKIVNIDKEEMDMGDKDLIETIKKQNKIESNIESFHMCLLKRLKLSQRTENQTNRKPKEEGSIIVEMDENTYRKMMREGKVNVGWRKCPIFEHVNVMRCFKCWGYYHMARNCKKDTACYKCAGSHAPDKCVEHTKKCVNCAYRVQKFNLKIDEGHDALSLECPTYQRALREERRRTSAREDI